MAASEATTTLVIKAKDLTGPSLAKLKMGLRGVGSAALTLAKVGLAAVVTAALAATAALAGMVKGAIDEQVGIERLGKALKANVKGFDGNTDAIERMIKKREKLGFSDDDLRSSLSFLVTRFHDVGVASRVQATAMDVARLKGISLEKASSLVSRAMDGNKKALKELGINLPKTATKQERLAAIQKAAAGQAEAYGNTTKGAMESAQIAIADAGETIAGVFLPYIKDAAIWVRDNLGPAVDTLSGFMRETLIPALKKGAEWFGNVATAVGKVYGPVFSSMIPAIKSVGEAIFGKSGGGHNGREGASAGLVGKLKGLVTVLWGDGTGPLPMALNAVAAVFNEVIVPAIKGVIGILSTLLDWLTWTIDKLDKLIKLMQNARSTAEKQGYSWAPGVPVILPPGYNTGGTQAGGASGGWVGLHGPQTIRVGENGPEFIQSRGMMAQGSDYVAVPISRKALADMVDKELYFRLRRAGTAV